MSEWGDRIGERMREVGMTPTQLARACWIKSPSVHDWINGKTKKIEGDNLLSAARALGRDPEWILSGRQKHATEPDDKSQYAEMDVKALRIAMTGLIRALADSIPPAAAAFSENVQQLGEADNFDTSKGLLGRLRDIVASVQSALATVHPPPSRPVSGARTKR